MIGTIALTVRGLGLAARIVVGASLRRVFRQQRPRYRRIGEPFIAS